MIVIFLTIFTFIFGLFVGSFLNCVVYRLPRKESSLKGRSKCPECGHKLDWHDLIPVLSFLIQRGRCGYCKKKISLQHPLVELITGLLFVLILRFSFFTLGFWGKELLIFQNIIHFFYLLIIFSFLIIIFISDLKRFIIPDRIIFPAILLTFVFHLYLSFLRGDFTALKERLLSSILVSLFFLILFLFSRGKWIGFGDVKFSFFMGGFLGFPGVLVALFLSFLIGGIIGLGLILSGKAGLRTEIPFGPFLITGTFMAFFEGQSFINWYFSLIF